LGRPGKEIGVRASISVAQTLLEAGLVDELRLVIAPRIVGPGRKLFNGLPPINLNLVESIVSPTGYLLLNYKISN